MAAVALCWVVEGEAEVVVLIAMVVEEEEEEGVGMQQFQI